MPDTVRELAEILRDTQSQMIEWRESAARVGADEALCYLLYVYETLDLDKVTGVREDSKWVVDPEFVEKRKKKAQSIIQFANLLKFCPHPDAPAEDDEAEADDESESMDEDIEADPKPSPPKVQPEQAPEPMDEDTPSATATASAEADPLNVPAEADPTPVPSGAATGSAAAEP